MTKVEDFSFVVDGNTLAATRLIAVPDKPVSVLSLHGAGKASRKRIMYVLDVLASQGLSSMCFDFSGHGDSTGLLSGSSLQTRLAEANAACEFFSDACPDTIIASSMGAHVAAQLASVKAIKNLILFCPAAYGKGSEDLKFDDTFSAFIRKPGSYSDSLAFSSLGEFRGNLLVVVGSEDAVIPEEVVSTYYDCAPHARHREVLRIPHAGHQIHTWLEDHPDDRGQVLARLQALLF
ncbi:alpha/beta hydrolase [Rhizobium herbae]|uniref:Pimeloyl-ACP methyl ester carboxylesterase n=1 Tax=Rhizobium herbae TaxID=508661 RepID=A0ABS4EUF1_9HYPH|nr:alpha/beta hydrolase [Rhizobium herbae]MBP1861572.1 pimeloyl-ACP methyl ester carboxylesterase [Rhizobium herbae]